MSACENCGEIALIAKSKKRDLPLDEGTVTVDVEYSVCSSCGEAQVTPAQARNNKRHINEAKRAALGIPSSTDLKRMRARWKMTQLVAGKLLGVGPTAFSKYENGEMLPAAPTARLLNLVASDDHSMRLLVERYGAGLKITAPESFVVPVAAVNAIVLTITSTTTLTIGSPALRPDPVHQQYEIEAVEPVMEQIKWPQLGTLNMAGGFGFPVNFKAQELSYAKSN